MSLGGCGRILGKQAFRRISYIGAQSRACLKSCLAVKASGEVRDLELNRASISRRMYHIQPSPLDIEKKVNINSGPK
jgi:hypothetical protein